MSTEVAPRELVPLHAIESRREAMERCIGPLSTLGVFRAIEEFRANQDPEVFTDETPPDEIKINKLHAYLVSKFSSGDKKDEDVVLIAPTPEQVRLFKDFTFYGDSISSTIADTLENQIELTKGIVLPALVAAHHGIDKVKEIPELTGRQKATLLRSDDCARVLRSMSFSANGAYENPDRIAQDDVLYHPQESLRRMHDYGEDINEELLRKVDITQLCVKHPDGSIHLSPRAVQILRLFMKFDNQFQVRNNQRDLGPTPRRVNGSRGCPASIKTVPMLPEDLTDYQYQHLTTGNSPIASYDQERREFTLLRSPLVEFSHLVADLIYPRQVEVQSQTAQTCPQ